ncbi:MAG: glycogen/starch synthase [Candidatus Micrarchaeota archaeon]|nr:glycogen/starch synthase [Candidatus Micrarchaeota archaeon]
MRKVEPDFIVEVSSEAARKIGGIYTVLRSKAPYIRKKFHDNYLLVGLLDEKCHEEIEWETPTHELAQIFRQLEEQGVVCKYGRWTYGQNAQVICVNAKPASERIIEYVSDSGIQKDKQVNYFKYMLWKHYGIDSLMEKSWDFTENVIWGFGAGMLIERLSKSEMLKNKKVVLQFHEWISGAALLYCKMRNLGLPTVFTTHATVLGRTLASAGVDVYSESMKAKEPISLNVAYNNRVEGKHQLEAAAAKECTVFTTVSETVAQEVKYILGKEADLITINGIELPTEKNVKEEEHFVKYVRDELLQFVEACFVSYYQQSYKDPLLVYISGRYEFLNKGFDIYISALGILNERLKKNKKNKRRIFAFIFAPSSVKGPKISIIKNYLLIDKITEVMQHLPKDYKKDYINLQNAISKLDGEIRYDIENMAKGFVKDGNFPHINCYDLTYQNDSIINACVNAGLDNREENVVKVLFYPTYMKPNDGLMNLNYYDVISAMDIGVFPSRYEPFGYTPVEAAIKKGIAITSDMTGFGKYIENKKGSGVFVLKMAGKRKEEAAQELAQMLERFYMLPLPKLEKLKKEAYYMMKHLDWNKLIKNYYDAYSLALSKK